ncbi:MAG: winged helix-turn-helix domain-containing protein [Aeromonas sobria]
MSKRIPIIATSLATGEQYVYQSIAEAADVHDLSTRYVGECARGLIKHYAGFTFAPVSGIPEDVKPSPRLLPIAELRNQGMTAKQIAEATGLKLETVRRYGKQAERLGLITYKLRA